MKSTFKISKRVLGLRLISFLIMLVERMAACFWRPVSWALLFCALWLFQIPSFFGDIGRVVSFFAFGIGLLLLIKRDALHFRIPNIRDIDRRIEKDSDVKNRPLTGLQDRLANDEKRDARRLWATSRARLLGKLDDLRPAQLRDLLSYDPYGLRFAVFAAFIGGLILAGPQAPVRLKEGLAPFSYEFSAKAKAERYTLIIDAPEYTGRAQMILNDKTIKGEPLKIAQGSNIKVLVNGGFGKPELIFGEDAHSFKDAYERSIPGDAQDIVLKQGFQTLATWPYEIIPDTPPALKVLSETPETLEQGSVSFALSVKDDYGVQYLDTTMTLDDMVEEPPKIGSAVTIRRSVVSPDGEDFELSPNYDFTAHPWAGLPVTVNFTAIDEISQASEPQSISFVLPQRVFEHPVAKTLITLRKSLIWNPLDDATYDKLAYDLHVLRSAKDLIHNDIVVYLALRTASLRLHYNLPSLETTNAVIGLMWDTALRVEDGDLSLAARRLRDAQMALEDALQKPDISEEEISQLMADLRQAMAEYLNELAREMSKRMAEGQEVPMLTPDAMSSMNHDALSDFMEQMEQAMREGDMSSAQEMLSQMQRLMDMMNPSMNAQMPQDMQMMNEGINELQELIERQEALLGQTLKQADLMDMLGGLGLNPPINILPQGEQEGTKDAPPFVNTQANQTEQEALRYILGQLMIEVSEAIDDIPEAMGLAEQEMRDSAHKLGLNWPHESIPHQEQAREYLKQSQEEMAQQLQQRMVQMTGFMLSFGQKQQRYDPLGRPMGQEFGPNGDPFGSQVKVPEEAERKRVREILKLLRQRAGQQNRPREELDYYRRLLKRF